jgi:hypothetical protein
VREAEPAAAAVSAGERRRTGFAANADWLCGERGRRITAAAL